MKTKWHTIDEQKVYFNCIIKGIPIYSKISQSLRNKALPIESKGEWYRWNFNHADETYLFLLSSTFLRICVYNQFYLMKAKSKAHDSIIYIVSNMGFSALLIVVNHFVIYSKNRFLINNNRHGAGCIW